MQFAMPSMTPAVKALIIANAIVFAALFAASFANDAVAYAVNGIFGIQPSRWAEWFPFLPLWQIVTWGFLHSIQDPWHILGNMLFLYFLGTMLEGVIGTRRFLVVYFSALLVSGLCTLGTGFFMNPGIPTVGASGAVLCVVVAMAVLRPKTRIIFLIFPITLQTLAIIYVSFDVFNLLLSLKGASSNVAHFAHLSGAAWGFLIARQGWIWRDPVQKVAEWRAEREEQQAYDDDALLDELLAKINRSGIGSLTPREKAFLKRTSKRR